MERTLHSLMGGKIRYGAPRGFEAGRQILMLHSKAIDSEGVRSQEPLWVNNAYERCTKSEYDDTYNHVLLRWRCQHMNPRQD